jgi:hypothetical protein
MKEKIQNLEKQIEREITQCEKYLEKGKELQNEYTPLIIQEIKNDIKKEIENFVKTDIDNTNNLGLEELSKIKKEMNILIDSIDNLLSSLLENKDIWKVSKEFIDNIDSEKGNIYNIKSDSIRTILSSVENVIKNEFIKVGDILIKYKYLKDKTVRPWEKRGNTFIYDSIVCMNDDLRNKMKEYTNLFTVFLASKENIVKLEKELKQTKALYLWEQA